MAGAGPAGEAAPAGGTHGADHPAGLTPIPISPRARTIALLGAVVALVLLVRAVPGVLTILLGGGALALVLSFPVRLLARVLPRGLAILLVLLALLLALVVALVTLVPVAIEQLTALVAAAPGLAAEAERQLRALLQPLRERGYLRTSPDQVIDNLERGLIDRAQGLGQRALAAIFAALTGAIGTLIQGFGILFVAVYLLADIRRFKAVYLRLAPRPYRDDAAALWDAFGQTLARYLGGLVISLAVQGVLAWLGLTLLGVPYPVLLGLWMAVSALIPYVGAWLGAIPAVALALFISPLTAVLTALLYLGINITEGELLTPRIQGRAINVHPLFVFLAVAVAGQLFGLAGIVFAVPVVGVLRVLFDFLAARLYVRRPEASANAPASRPAAATTGEAPRLPLGATVVLRAGERRSDPTAEREGKDE